MKNLYLTYFICLSFVIFHCISLAQAQQSNPVQFSVFLLGDAGETPRSEAVKNLALLEQQLKDAGENSALILLGDNLYPIGLPEADHPKRKLYEDKLLPQLQLAKNFKGKFFILPGNHDWERGRKKGLIYVNNQEKFAENYFEGQNVFLPDEGCPGPVEISLDTALTLVIVDTQWWLHNKEQRPGEESDCECKSETEILQKLEDIFQRNRHKQILVSGHHPMYTYGEHNGAYNWKDHLFPLQKPIKGLWLPLPVVGSLYPLYRSVFGHIQDLPHPRNRLMRQSILSVLEKYPNIVYVNGHDHHLQYIQRDSLHFVISGSGSKRSKVRKGKYSKFSRATVGFARLDYFFDQEMIRLQFWTQDQTKQPVYETYLPTRKISKTTKPSTEQALTQTSIETQASTQYKGGAFKRFMLGKNYRAEWEKKLLFPVFDFKVKGRELKITERGGGQQTKSLRLADSLGNEFVLRSIEKNPESAIPAPLRKTVFAELVQDQISSAHPYGALGVPLLAEAAKIPHSNPKIVFVGDDPRLGEYRELFKNTLSLFEERSIEKKNYSTTKILEKLKEDNDNHINQQNVLTARLLDIFIGDWDRHDDQWRWIARKEDKGMVFSPVPRDRDQAFFVNEGLLPKIVSRNWALPKIQGFGYKIRDIRTFNHNARYFDRSFLNGLSIDDWRNSVKGFLETMTDEAIEKAIAGLPTEIFHLRGKEIIDKLKKRRAIMLSEAEKYFRFLAKKTEITGSDKTEFFHIKRLNDTDTEVTVYKISKEGNASKILYQRVFYRPETREIRLYAYGGKDRFLVEGKTRKGIKIRIIGGEGEDKIEDISRVSGWAKKTKVYDLNKGNELLLNNEARNLTSSNPDVNLHDRKSFQYDLLMPLLSVQYNPDDGIFLGGGVLIKKHAFRKQPFAVQHKLVANHATATEAYNFDYQLDVSDVLRKTDLQINLEIKAPNFVNNFFGLGNDRITEENSRGINYYRVRFENWSLNALLRKKMGSKSLFYLGPQFENVEVEENPERFINDFNSNGLDATSIFERKRYLGAVAGFQVDLRNHKIFTTEGLYWKTQFKWMQGIGNFSSGYSQLQTELSLYWSFKLPAIVTLANRLGAGFNFADFEFFQANTLGGLTNLRGFRRTRFSGEDSFYNNTEIRIRLFSFRTYLFPAFFGILGFHDIGRVWLRGENSVTWHRGYGGGIWLAPFQMAVISAVWGFSKEDSFPLIRVGFQF